MPKGKRFLRVFYVLEVTCVASAHSSLVITLQRLYPSTTNIRNAASMGAWVAQSVKHLTLDFGSGHDLTVHELEPHIGLWVDSVGAAWDYLSLPLSLPLPCSCSVSLHLENK